MSERTLLVPDEQLPALLTFVSLTASERASISDALTQASPGLRLRDLVAAVASDSELDEERIGDVLTILSSLYATCDTLKINPSEFVNDVLNALSATSELDFSLENDEREQWTDFLASALRQHRSLGITTKALRVTKEHQNTICYARVYTDLRPLFTDGAERTIGAGVIVHTLKLHYHMTDGDGTLYVALEGTDLEKLKREIDRALSKESVLRTSLAKADFPILQGDKK